MVHRTPLLSLEGLPRRFSGVPGLRGVDVPHTLLENILKSRIKSGFLSVASLYESHVVDVFSERRLKSETLRSLLSVPSLRDIYTNDTLSEITEES